MHSNKPGLRYEDAGVNIDAGNEAVQLMKRDVQATYTPGVVGDLGGFGGLFSLAGFQHLKDPILVSGTDGVGTKLQIAIQMDQHDTIGQDCVAMCINDILVQGAKPLFFLDYVAVGTLHPKQVAAIVRGVAQACQVCGCALLGGETAEMPGIYQSGDYDVAGFAVGIVDRHKLITGADIAEGDVVLGLPSSGVHSNGYSLVRHIVFREKNLSLEETFPGLTGTLGETLLTPTRLYPPVVEPILAEHTVHGMVHITGGGFYENIPRVLPAGLGVEIDADAWETPAIFRYLQEWGNVPVEEMYRTFNMGVGMILIVPATQADGIKAAFAKNGETVYTLGTVKKTSGPSVVMKGREFQ